MNYTIESTNRLKQGSKIIVANFNMKALHIFFLFLPAIAFAQTHQPLPHGKIFGSKPDTTAVVDAAKVEAFMDKKVRISTTIRGKVIKVTKQKGGWFDIDAGNGKIIAAHFKTYNITIPEDLKGRTIIAEGVAAKQFIADDQQHFAGDTVTGKKQHTVKTNPKQRLTFEVKGLMID
jgi:Domain of unknown function (DUF4920)